VLAAIDLALAAAVTATSTKFAAVYFPYAALAIAAAILTFLTLPAMIALENLRPGGPTSMIIVEILWLFFLSILWLATGADAVDFYTAGFWFACGQPEFQDNLEITSCNEISALEGFAFVNWIILLVYSVMLLIMSSAAASRKHTGVWTSSVANAPFGVPAAPAVNMTPMSHGGQVAGVGGHSAGYNTANSVQAGAVHV